MRRKRRRISFLERRRRISFLKSRRRMMYLSSSPCARQQRKRRRK
jgi:hypothetical protein